LPLHDVAVVEQRRVDRLQHWVSASGVVAAALLLSTRGHAAAALGTLVPHPTAPSQLCRDGDDDGSRLLPLCNDGDDGDGDPGDDGDDGGGDDGDETVSL